MISTFGRSVLCIILAAGMACPLPVLADDFGAAPTHAPLKPVQKTPDEQASVVGNRAFDVLASWIGGEWRIDARWNDSRPFRARGVWEWGPGKRFVTAKTFSTADDGAEPLLCENIFAVVGDHVVNYGFGNDGSVSMAPMTIVDDGFVDSIWTSGSVTLRQKIKIIGPGRIAWELLTRETDGRWQRSIEGVWVRN